mmetsp:Transcript_20948/g.28496  ORF Transcript_20948/g.28496 Transcript_20948/m.28496 type:complete len:208 (-) Transcript_20948:1525-2148(-)
MRLLTLRAQPAPGQSRRKGQAPTGGRGLVRSRLRSVVGWKGSAETGVHPRTDDQRRIPPGESPAERAGVFHRPAGRGGSPADGPGQGPGCQARTGLEPALELDAPQQIPGDRGRDEPAGLGSPHRLPERSRRDAPHGGRPEREQADCEAVPAEGGGDQPAEQQRADGPALRLWLRHGGTRAVLHLQGRGRLAAECGRHDLLRGRQHR